MIIIFWTGDRDRCFAVGMNDIIAKPILRIAKEILYRFWFNVVIPAKNMRGWTRV